MTRYPPQRYPPQPPGPAPPYAPPGPPGYRAWPTAPRRVGQGGLVAVLVCASLVVLLAVTVLAVVARQPAGSGARRSLPNAPAVRADPQHTTGITDAEIRALLEQHGSALRRGDLTRFLSAYDQTDHGLIAGQRMLYTNLRKIPLAIAYYTLMHRSGQAGPLGSIDVDVAFVHQVAGVDVDRVFEGYRWRIARTANTAPLRVSAVGGMPDPATGGKYLYYPAPWDELPLTVTRRRHVVLLANDRTRGLAATWAATAELSAEQNLQAWGRRPAGSPGFLVTFEDLRSRFHGYWSGNSTGPKWEAGHTISLPAFTTGGQAARSAGARIVSFTGSSFYAPGHDPSYLFTHEMAHAMVSPVGPESGAGTPLYIVEGFARFMETRHHSTGPFMNDPALIAHLQHGFTGHLPTDAQLRSSKDDVAGAAYELSLLVYLFIEHRFGSSRCFDLVIAAYQKPTETGGQAALAKTTGLNLAAFEAQWVAYVHHRVG